MKKILATGNEISMKKGQQIFKEGQEANGVHVKRPEWPDQKSGRTLKEGSTLKAGDE